MKTKYIKPETRLLDIDLAEHLTVDVDATGTTVLPDDGGKVKRNNDWVFEDEETDDGWW